MSINETVSIAIIVDNKEEEKKTIAMGKKQKLLFAFIQVEFSLNIISMRPLSQECLKKFWNHHRFVSLHIYLLIKERSMVIDICLQKSVN